MRLSYARSAGLLLLLTAVATAVSVMTRLSGSGEPLENAPVQLPIILDTGQYAISAVARLVSGFALVAAAACLRLSLRSRQPVAAGIAATILELSGAATALSGAAMLALAVELPQSGAASAVSLTAWDSPGWVAPVDGARWIAGTVGFFLAGLGLIALGPVQWRMGGVLKIFALAGVIIGIAMLFIWVDAATVVHRISGIAFLIWLIVTGLWLALGLMRTGQSPQR